MHPITYSLIMNLAALLILAGVGIYTRYDGTLLLIVVAILIQTHALQRFSRGAEAEGDDDDDDEPAIGFLAEVDKK